MRQNIVIGLITGALLGVICIVGASLRNPDATNVFLFAFWFNRVVMGLAIGMMRESSRNMMILKGLVLGTFISFTFYSATNFEDLMGFIAGMAYGVIIGFAVYYFPKRNAA